MGALNDLRDAAHEMAKSKGWYDANGGKRNIGEALMLVTCEAAEMMEDVRCGYKGWWYDAAGKPIGPDIEAADILIRMFDLAGHLGIDLDEVVRVKMAYNATRPIRHGKLL